LASFCENVTPLVVPAGAWLANSYQASYWIGDFLDDVIWDVRTFDEGDLVVGQSLDVAGVHAGLCAHILWSGGLHFTLTTIPWPDIGIGPPTMGWAPGWTGPPAP